MLYFLGLFDRPASIKLLDEVFPKKPSVSSESSVVPPKRALLAAIKDLFGLQPGKLTEPAPKFDTLPLGDLFDAFAGSSVEQIRHALGQLSRQGLVAIARRLRCGNPQRIAPHPGTVGKPEIRNPKSESGRTRGS